MVYVDGLELEGSDVLVHELIGKKKYLVGQKP